MAISPIAIWASRAQYHPRHISTDKQNDLMELSAEQMVHTDVRLRGGAEWLFDVLICDSYTPAAA